MIEALIENLGNFLWGGEWNGERVFPLPLLPPLGYALLGAGLWFMVILRARPLRRLGSAFAELWQGREAKGDGAITPWQALSTALSGQVGTGNLAGVATAISLGGPGAIFWMWVTALFGMAAAFAEASLAVHYREKNADGQFFGGPMYYIKNGLGKNWAWLAVFFSVATIICSFLTGNTVQANSIATAVSENLRSIGIGTGVGEYIIPVLNMPIDPLQSLAGLILAGLVFAVIVGGIKSIGSVAGRVVPFMGVAYLILALIVLIMNFQHIPAAFGMIFSYAFGLEQAVGGAAGYTIAQAIRFGVARGLFSNEAGQGSTPIAHAAAQTNSPVKQGEIAMLGAFIDTIVICTLTALVLLVIQGDFAHSAGSVAYAWQSDTLKGIEITSAVYRDALWGGNWIILITLIFFAFTTIIGWSYYAEQALSYLTGSKSATIFRYCWVLVVFLAASSEKVNLLWVLGDLGNGLMAIPNLIAIIALSGVVLKLVRDYDAKRFNDGESKKV